MISLILTIHNQAEILSRVLTSITQNSSIKLNHIIIILDGCTDNSEFIVRSFPFASSTIIVLNNVFETKANNIGLSLVKNPYTIITQDDCIINEKDWDLRLLKPVLEFKDIFAVTGRTAHNIGCLENGLVFYYDEADKVHGSNKDKFYIRQVVNRGPLLLKMDVVKELNYFDEIFYPQSQDDHDLCLKAYKKGWKCGSYWIDSISDPSWGGTRKGDGIWIRDAISKNMKIINYRYHDMLLNTWNEERYLP